MYSHASGTRLLSLPSIRYAWPGKTLVQEGEVGRGLFLIDRGFVRVTREGAAAGVHTGWRCQ